MCSLSRPLCNRDGIRKHTYPHDRRKSKNRAGQGQKSIIVITTNLEGLPQIPRSKRSIVAGIIPKVLILAAGAVPRRGRALLSARRRLEGFGARDGSQGLRFR